MKRLFTIACLLLAACNATQSTDRLLAEVWEKDQTIRHRLQELTKQVTAEGRTELLDSLVVTIDRVEHIDSENLQTVEQVLCNGLPEGLSEASYRTIWIVIDHAPQERQEHYLPMVGEMAERGLIGRSAYATLFDRVAMKQNRPQRYGTQSVQFGTPEAMQLHLWPLENPVAVDSLRATVGLSPLADYLETLTSTTGLAISFDPAQTVESLNSLRSATEQ